MRRPAPPDRRPCVPRARGAAPFLAGMLLAAAMAAAPLRAAAEALTLDQVIAAAGAANARLPVARAEEGIGEAGVLEARASRGPELSLDGGLRQAPSSAEYNAAVGPTGEDRLQLLLRQPLYDGGERGARVRAARARRGAARAGLRAAARDVELEARLGYGDLLEAEAERAARRRGLERLHGYLLLVRERAASGEGLERDRLRTEVRLAREEAAAEEAERRVARARLELNDLMGRDPGAPLELAPLPPPAPPAAAGGGEPWAAAPDVARAEARRQEAEAGVAEQRALRRPQLELTADAGLFGPGLFAPGVPGTLPDRLRSDLGASVGLRLSWPLWDSGRRDARLQGARLRLERAGAELALERRRARLSWDRAGIDLAALHRVVALRAGAVPRARDSLLLSESLYRGGVGSSLDVLDAHAALVDAEIAEARATRDYRAAEAELRRWSEP